MDVYADIRELDYPMESVEEIRLHHVFEHFDRPTALSLLIKWYGWLNDDGRLIIETPDFRRCVSAFLRSRKQETRHAIQRHIFGSHETAWAFHYDGWSKDRFKLYLESLGYSDLSFELSKWQGLYNITVTARKQAPFRTRDEMRQAAEDLLKLSMVDDSETEQCLLKVWTAQLEQLLRTPNKAPSEAMRPSVQR